MRTDYVGIDYGMGQTNIDRETGIRYGVISQNAVLQAWADSSEADYGKPSCPKCGNEAVDGESDGDRDEYKRLHHCCGDYACDSCRILFDGDDAYGDEALGFTLDDGEYKASAGQDGDIFILKSPYYTRAQFCSPCAPGAAYLENPCDDGPKAYCFGADWFDPESDCPYTVYRVSDDSVVYKPVSR